MKWRIANKVGKMLRQRRGTLQRALSKGRFPPRGKGPHYRVYGHYSRRYPKGVRRPFHDLSCWLEALQEAMLISAGRRRRYRALLEIQELVKQEQPHSEPILIRKYIHPSN